MRMKEWSSYEKKIIPIIIAIVFLIYYNEVYNISNHWNHYYKNTRISIIGENGYEYLVLLLGIILSNNVVVLIDKDLEEEKISNLLKISNTKNYSIQAIIAIVKKIILLNKTKNESINDAYVRFFFFVVS